MTVNHRIVLDTRPTGEASVDNFRMETAEIAALTSGQVLIRHHYLSLDPYMRGRMNDTQSYAPPQPLGKVMVGATAGEVMESRSDQFVPGQMVVGRGGWQEYSVVEGPDLATLRKVDSARIALSHHLGALGAPGVTAWYGLTVICKPKAGETMLVSAATGAVGSAVGALSKARGCHTVGIAGGPDKCRYALSELGFDACIDYKAHSSAETLSAALAQACPKGIDGYFENVGGMVLDAILPRMNARGRVAVCGMISGYEGAAIPLAAPQLILTSRLTLQGFSIGEHADVWPQALAELGTLFVEGKLRPRETIAEGLAAAPQAMLGLLRGRNLGKQLVKLV
ncbi:MAG: NADP-dependent oxidoreductase [Burkholderiaceae bacterium]